MHHLELRLMRNERSQVHEDTTPSNRVFRRMRIGSRVAGLSLILGLLGAAPGLSAPAPTLDWLQGDWRGVRRDAADGTEAPLTVHVEPFDVAPGQIERVEVKTKGVPYVGFTVRMPLETPARWLMIYANSTRETFSRLHGVVQDGRVTWRSTATGSPRMSNVIVERIDDDHWKRTNSVSEDGGKSWHTLFIDEVERDK